MDQEKRLRLKEKAKYVLDLTEQSDFTNDPEAFDHIIQELQIYQVELELQNDELVDTQANLQKQLAHTSVLFNTLPTAATVVDERGLLTEINETALALFGFRARSLALQHSLFRLLDHTSSSWLYDALHECSSQHVLSNQLMIKTRDEHWIPVKAHLLLIPKTSNMQGHAVIIFRDLSTDLKLQRQQQQFQNIINNSRNLIFLLDSEFKLQLANRAFHDICQGSSSEFAIGNSLLDLLLVDEVLEMQNMIAEVFRSNSSVFLPCQKMTILGVSRYFSCQAFPIELEDSSQLGVAVVASDITELTLANQKIAELAFYDSLTGAANRALLNDRIDQLIGSHSRNSNAFVLLFIDLDHFKQINDLYGHNIGDQLLVSITNRLTKYCRPQDTVARLGGDEFVILLPGMTKQEAKSRSYEILAAIAVPYNEITHQLEISASIGVVQFPQDATDKISLLQYADAAMYNAKDNGKNQISFFDQSLISKIKQRASLSNALRHAIEQEEFTIVLQPLFTLENDQLYGAEVLLRWHSKTLGSISPDDFIPVAEGNGSIKEIGQWVTEQAFTFLSQQAHQLPSDFMLTINVSGYEFWQDDYAMQFSQRLKHYQINPSQIELELTETIAMQRPEQAMLIMKALKASGIRIALDDFGTGYSSLGYLKQLPIDTVKIDKTFISDIGLSKDSETICNAIVSLGNALGLSSTAEGIETKYQLNYMKSLGCKIGQGYYFAKPLAIAEFIERFSQPRD